MMFLFRLIVLPLFFLACSSPDPEENNNALRVAATIPEIPNEQPAQPGDSIKSRFQVPEGFVRLEPLKGSFGHYLQNLPLKPIGSAVYLYNGELKGNQMAHEAVVMMDVGKRDLQQCADAVMRLRAEYLFEEQAYQDIHFNFTNGFRADYAQWRAGKRIRVNGNRVSWISGNAGSTSYSSFRQYLTMVFSYAGTASLAKELRSKDWTDLDFGDVFIQGGFPGHAVIVVDVAVHKETGQRAFLLAQSYMPAQEIHILANPMYPANSPWYLVDNALEVVTPEWTFATSDLKTF